MARGRCISARIKYRPGILRTGHTDDYALISPVNVDRAATLDTRVASWRSDRGFRALLPLIRHDLLDPYRRLILIILPR